MQYEFFAFFGIVIALFTLGAELGRKPFLGIAAGLLLIILSLWVQNAGIYIPVGSIQTTVQVQDCPGACELQNATSINTNSTITTVPTYQKIPDFSTFMTTQDLLFLVLLLSGIYMVFVFSEEIIFGKR